MITPPPSLRKLSDLAPVLSELKWLEKLAFALRYGDEEEDSNERSLFSPFSVRKAKLPAAAFKSLVKTTLLNRASHLGFITIAEACPSLKVIREWRGRGVPYLVGIWAEEPWESDGPSPRWPASRIRPERGPVHVKISTNCIYRYSEVPLQE